MTPLDVCLIGALQTQDSMESGYHFTDNWKHIIQAQILNSQQQLEGEVRNQQSRKLEQQS